ncbi:MAG: phosphoenolpyruvate--protein phosphotransferase [Candidatus Competibacteraceae bacterium]|nr:phosphoenolpyruvate--protein phosphotransferase [Candidatus Competibacteraceae bacterium]MBK8897709.1 phosphoenolpyruvate--protein phosphotransferase [Candidatus Competibacteraceae bacterium]MBK9950740.1 phosphoenolpyruvate--protein phosphotransferase [Candidatus Competibacteraceae bacterium]
MLETLRHIAQEVSTALDLPDALATAVQRIRDTLRVAACSLYLADPEHDEFVLAAAAGLHPSAVGQLRLNLQHGLVSLIAERQEPLNLQDASRHPRFCETSGHGEDGYRAFLGAPLIQYRRTLGVLVAQDTAVRQFQADELNLLLTLAAQLASRLDRAAGGPSGVLKPPPLATGVQALQGVSGAGGVAIGAVTIPERLIDLDDVPDRAAADPAAEDAAFRAAIAAVDDELRSAGERLAPLLPPTEQSLFAAHRMLLNSDSLLDETRARIQAGSWAQGAWCEAVLARARLLEQSDDSYLSARADDIRDLGRRVLHHLRAGTVRPTGNPCERCVLLAEEMSVAHLAAVPDRLAAIVCLRGSALSHVSILARAMGIPAVMGLGDRPIGGFEGCEIIVDGYQGRVFINPDRALRQEYHQLIAADAELSAGLAALRDLPAETQDGYRLPLYAKAGLLSDIGSARACGADGIGLYRTEFAFMLRDSFPSTDEQCALYRQMLEAFAPRPVVIRTLDIGGDKCLPYFSISEKNPFLGWRGMRFTLDRPDIFMTQLRALLRANAGLNNLRVLFPMITTVEEVDEALRLLERAQRELAEDELAHARPRIGVMIEVPSAALQAAQLASRVDFLAVGTNDLTQYLLAVDRDNSRVAGLYDSLHPAMLKIIAHIIEDGRQAGRPVNLCGEMSADPGAAILLLGMGAASLSAGATSVPRVKWAIRSFTRAQAQELTRQALQLDTARQVHRLLNDALRRAGLGKLVREPP